MIDNKKHHIKEMGKHLSFALQCCPTFTSEDDKRDYFALQEIERKYSRLYRRVFKEPYEKDKKTTSRQQTILP